MAVVVVYMTASSQDEATRLGRLLIEKRLAACVNILGPIRSLYWWDEAVQDEAEIAFLAKTRQACLDELVRTVQAAHSYDEPCIVALPATGGSAGFLDWIQTETSPRADKE